jgi:hypothetical protein
MQKLAKCGGFALGVSLFLGSSASAEPFFFSTGSPDGLMATASQPSSSGKTEIEAADDFALTVETSISSASFTGLLTGVSPSIVGVRVEIYQVFPLDSTSPPSGNVPSRTNSPSDVALLEFSSPADITFGTSVLSSSFTAANSVLNGINPSPGQHTGGDGPVTGEEVQFNITFTTTFDLSAGHYFFVPQVELAGSDEFFWLSAPRPIVPPGTAFPVGFTDLQEWIRNSALDPDWLRVGADIVGTPALGPTFNATFSLTGNTVPEPITLSLFGAGLAGLVSMRRRRQGSSRIA